MKTITIEIDDNYATVLSFTAVGKSVSMLNVTTACVEIQEQAKFKIDEKGKLWKPGDIK